MISFLLWLALRRITDVLLTLVPLLVAGAVTLEICVLIGLPLNFANIVALPLLLGVGVAFKIYYVTAWRSGQNQSAAIEPDAGDILQRADDRHGVRKPVAVEPSGHGEHGQAAGAVAGHDARRGAAVSACANGQTARCRGVGRYRRPDRRLARPVLTWPWQPASPDPVVFGAARVAVLGVAASASSARPWPCCWRGSRESGRRRGSRFRRRRGSRARSPEFRADRRPTGLIVEL